MGCTGNAGLDHVAVNAIRQGEPFVRGESLKILH